MNRESNARDVLITGMAPVIWGSTYLITTEMLPQGYPLTTSMLRALPAGILLLLLVRQLPDRHWLGRIFLLGALNFSVFWWLLFIAAYRLPGGVAATLGAMQFLFVIVLSRGLLGTKIHTSALIAAVAGMLGVALLILTPAAKLDPVGIAAGIGSAVAMALGTVLSRRWQPAVSTLTFTSWQLTAGGILLVPAAWLFEPALPPLTLVNIAGFLYLGLLGAAFTYIIWFRGIARLSPNLVAPLGFLSPLSAVMLGWLILGQALSVLQILGIVVVLGSVWLSQQRKTSS
ncbi:transporter permease [Alishewanella agri BL06]|uniref:Transporter permease n=1 Tax=Alishewanella agri BL06 TaxID=1195246 RepID=I9DTS2_9ALTE|nr:MULTISPECIES: EamA family transporter [Alishewanella]EIW89540.1 transporter permease [Alishewanella agri BL06]KRS22697.1 ABC transporter permease [Alishewanella sp. WH16-1]